MPVDYQPPMDVPSSPPAYYQAAQPIAYAGNADAQRFMTDPGAAAYGQPDYQMVPPVQAAQAAPPAYQPAAYQPAAYQGASGNPFPGGGYQPVNPGAAQPSMAQLPAATYQPVQYYPTQGYAPPAYQPPAYQAQAPVQTYAAPSYQQAPAYQQPTYSAPPQQSYPSYSPPSQPALAYPSETYGRQGFGTQPYGNADYAIAPVPGYQKAPRPTYTAPAYTPPIQSYAAPTYYASPVYSQPQPQPTYVVRSRPTKVYRSKWRPKRVARVKARTRYVTVRPEQQPVQSYSYPAQPVQSYAQPAPTYQPQPAYAPQPSYPPQPTYAPQQAPAIPYAVPAPNTYGAATGDPEMDRINAEIASLSADSAPRVEGGIGFRYRDGEVGLGRLNEVSGRVAASTGLGPGRVELSVSPVYIDAGAPKAQGLTRFGTNPLPEAQAVAGGFAATLPTAPTQQDRGIAVKLAYDTGNLSVDAGTTPIGFNKTEIQGGARWTPRIGQNVTARIFAERRPVTDSVVSYAGTVDPATNVRWGQVMKTGGGGGVSYDRGAGGGLYVDGNFYHYDGTNVRNNWNVEVNVGGYLTAWRRDTSTITAGLNLNYQHYDNSQNYFSYGNGGYFSPQQYFSISFPLRFRTISGPLSLDATLTPGFQTYRQSSAAVFPTSDPLQAQLLNYQAGDAAVLARYSSLSKSGFGVAFQGVGWYRVAPSTAIGGELRLNTFGGYNEAQALLRLRQSLGGGVLQ